MTYQIITRSYSPQVVDLAEWRAKYHAAKREELGHPAPHVASPSRVLFNREAAIEQGVRGYARLLAASPSETAAAIACAIRKFRSGHSAASAIQAGRTRAGELVWGKSSPTSA